MELSEPGGSASTDRRGERVGEEPGACWNAGEEPWEGAPRTGGGGQGASRCASAGITVGLGHRPPWGFPLCREPSGQGPGGQRQEQQTEGVLMRKKGKGQTDADDPLLRRRPDLAQDVETCLGGRLVTASWKPARKFVAGAGEFYYQSQHILRRRKKNSFSIFRYF